MTYIYIIDDHNFVIRISVTVHINTDLKFILLIKVRVRLVSAATNCN